MAISRFCIKRLKSPCEIDFYCIWWLKFCNLCMKYAVSQRCSLKSILKNFSKFMDKHKKQSSRGVLPIENTYEFCELFKNTYFVEDIQTAGLETLVPGPLFNKVASRTA